MKNEYRIIILGDDAKIISQWIDMNDKRIDIMTEVTKVLENQGYEVNFEYR